jgi:hypothetical protein
MLLSWKNPNYSGVRFTNILVLAEWQGGEPRGI